MDNRWTKVLLLVLALFFPIQSIAQDTASPAGIAQQSNEDADAEIDVRITDIFRQIDGLGSIFVSVEAGVVTLRGKVTTIDLAYRAEDLAQRVEGVVAVTNRIEEETSVEERLAPVLERSLDRLKSALRLAPLAIIAVTSWALIILAGWFVSSRDWPWSRIAPNSFIANLLRQLVWLVFIAVGGILALDIMGASALIGTVLGAAGIVGLAVGFAVRDTVENYIASILLSIRQPFRPKDFVDIEGRQGNVLRLTSRATILIEPSGNHVRIPNSTVFKSIITNYTRNPSRRFEFRVGVAAESDLADAVGVGVGALSNLPFVLHDPGPDAWIEELGDSNVIIVFVGWVDQRITNFSKARSEAMRVTKETLESDGFALPEPIYRLKVDGVQPNQLKEIEKGNIREHREHPKKPKVGIEASDVSAETAVIEQIDDERASGEGEDLLQDQGTENLE